MLAKTINQLFKKIETNEGEERNQEANKDGTHATYVGVRSKGVRINFIGLNHSRWNPPSYDVIKLNVDVAWGKGQVSLAILARSYDVKVLGLRYDNY